MEKLTGSKIMKVFVALSLVLACLGGICVGEFLSWMYPFQMLMGMAFSLLTLGAWYVAGLFIKRAYAMATRLARGTPGVESYATGSIR